MSRELQLHSMTSARSIPSLSTLLPGQRRSWVAVSLLVVLAIATPGVPVQANFSPSSQMGRPSRREGAATRYHAPQPACHFSSCFPDKTTGNG